jgi:hypothetical protein
MKFLLAVLLILHRITAAFQSSRSFNPVESFKNPAWLSRWPVNLSQSWLLSPLHFERALIARAGEFL